MSSNSAKSHDEGRPDPDVLLDRYGLRHMAPTSAEATGESSRSHRGRLRVYLGMAAGVGKTFAMLNEGRRRAARGTDVVVGWVDTHGRALTEQQIGELEVIPRRKVSYRGVTLEEMDVDAILARKPAVALVDELAHTNVPGSRNAKRSQDVEELLAAGITVITTVNVQHLEGLNDVVEAFTGIRQRETIPDAIVDNADEIELVDISPDALRARMRHGNVYPPDRAQKALESYFTVSNLTALRELALRRVSEKTERQLERMMGRTPSGDETGDVWKQAGVTDRVLVALDACQISSQEAQAETRRLLHEGARLARALHAPLLALALRGHHAEASSGAQNAAWSRHCQIAEDLGAEIVEMSGSDLAAAIGRIVRERQVTIVVVPRESDEQAHSRNAWRFARRRTLAERLLQMRLHVDLYVAAPEGQEN
ncbi:MAG TPA: sensor histidine kinase KdpD [Ktedonobacterales bacterium]